MYENLYKEKRNVKRRAQEIEKESHEQCRMKINKNISENRIFYWKKVGRSKGGKLQWDKKQN